jgi:hypothetical protein
MRCSDCRSNRVGAHAMPQLAVDDEMAAESCDGNRPPLPRPMLLTGQSASLPAPTPVPDIGAVPFSRQPLPAKDVYPLPPLSRYPVKTRQNDEIMESRQRSWGSLGSLRTELEAQMDPRVKDLDAGRPNGPPSWIRRANVLKARAGRRCCRMPFSITVCVRVSALHPIGGTKRSDLDCDSAGGVGVGMRRREMLE